jgi:acetylcholinesterase
MTTTLIKSLGIFSLYIGSVVSTSNLVRETTSGPATGFIDSAAAPNVAQFLSIPYAEPPIGELRWQPPTLKKTGGAINATAFGNVCTQLLPSAPSLHTEDAPEFNPPANAPAGEDCLSVSIWTPKNACSSNASLPVIIWIPGGAFYTGGANVPYQNPTQWIERSQEHIVVSVKLVILSLPPSTAPQ